MYSRDSLWSIHLIGFVIILLMYVVYVLCRIGLHDDVNLLPLLLAISILFLPIAAQSLVKLPLPMLQVASLLFFFCLGWISIFSGIDLSLILYVTAIFPAFLVLRRIKFRVNWRWALGGVLT